MKKVLFIHRSVGRDLLHYGKLRNLLNAKDIALDDYDNNQGVLTRNNGAGVKDLIEMPGNNTNPANFADLFTQWPELLNDYDMVMIKSCYPNSHIKDEAQLNAIKEDYQTIFKAFEGRNKTLLILTTPPLRPRFTNRTEARLAKELANWLTKTSGSKVNVFDLHHLYSDKLGKHKGMLKREYSRWLPWDNHPNRKAHKIAAPLIAELVSKV